MTTQVTFTSLCLMANLCLDPPRQRRSQKDFHFLVRHIRPHQLHGLKLPFQECQKDWKLASIAKLFFEAATRGCLRDAKAD
mmetsp:Transcript_75569/g.149881  ORF Transcript_75569/g.149881 Transcript_75569/m.149881 type:complete len:81 (-) Transcript_75569:1460-1702(-)